MSDHILWSQSKLSIPNDQWEEAIEKITERHPHLRGCFKGEHLGLSLSLCLEDVGFCAYEHPLAVDIGCPDDNDIDFLPSLAGIVPAGCHVTGWDDGGTYWQIRYGKEHCKTVYGTVTFPAEDEYQGDFPTSFPTD